MWNCLDARDGNPISEHIFLKPKCSIHSSHSPHSQTYYTLLPAVNCLCPILRAKNTFLGSQQMHSPMGDIGSLSMKGIRVYLGLVWAAAPGQEGLDGQGGSSGLADFQRDFNHGARAPWQCQGRVLPTLTVCFRGEGMCKWTQKGGEMLPVGRSQHVLLPPLGRGDVAVTAKRLSSPQGPPLLCPAPRNALLETLQHSGLSPVTALLSVHLSYLGSDQAAPQATIGAEMVALCWLL